MPQDKLVVRGAREHNLKNLDVDIPRDQLVVITGISGSGKSSLAFDTIYAEGQRRYVESLSAYARQFLGQMEKPDVDQIDGLSPAISIDQKGASHNPRSTVGTVTEVYDYLRLLFARVGVPHCPSCGNVVARQTPDQIADAISELPDGSRILILAPLVRDRKGTHEKVFEDIRKAGFVRVRIDGEIRDVSESFEVDRKRHHSVDAVVDRLVVRHRNRGKGAGESGIGGEADEGGANDRGDGEGLDRARLHDSVETALELGDGVLSVLTVGREGETHDERLFSMHFSCPDCGVSLPEIEPRSFSFNSPQGACIRCQGLGSQRSVDGVLVVPNSDLSIREGAIAPWSKSRNDHGYYMQPLASVAEAYGFTLDVPWRELSRDAREVVLGGTGDEQVEVHYRNRRGEQRHYSTRFEGVVANLQRRYDATESDYVRTEIEKYMTSRPCPSCLGGRLRPEIVAVTIAGRSIVDVVAQPVRDSLDWIRALGTGRGHGAGIRASGEQVTTTRSGGEQATAGSGDGNSSTDEPRYRHDVLTERDQLIAREVLKEIEQRLGFLVDVGLDYLTLDREARTLAGGEAQRIRLATQIGSQLMGVLYILDEPSIGLHQRDNARLIRTLLNLRDVGNTVLIVEHDEEMMRSADWIVDLGPGAGERGGELVAEGPVEAIEASSESVTGAYLSGRRQVPVPDSRRPGSGASLRLTGVRANNLRSIDVEFPLGTLTVVTGVSGSGKSTLVIDVLYARLAQLLGGVRTPVGEHDRILGHEALDKVIDIDQSPIGRTPRSNPATYTNLFAPIRDLFAALPEAKVRGYKPGRFSFNVRGGRCEACRGDGILKIEMQFLPDVYVPCEVCHGARYDRETLQIRFKGKSIADVLDMTVAEAREFFSAHRTIKRKLDTLDAVGLGYVRLGQPAPTLSGGEAQRIKLSRELSRVATGNTLYILDEPTTGLHFADVEKLLAVLQALVDAGNTVIIIEHNMDVIKTADWIIDLGPEGGERGGSVVATGEPEAIAQLPESHTGTFLARVLDGKWALDPASSTTNSSTARGH